MFNDTTIFFCDIVDFTNIASDSTANQNIDFLSDLYSLFDERLDNYDVYKVLHHPDIEISDVDHAKVETIGDAYMVASGVPVPNGNQHAMEVAMMSLDLLAKILTFEIQVVLCILIDATLCPPKSDYQNAAGTMVTERAAGTIPVTGVSNGMVGVPDSNQVALLLVLVVFSVEFLGGTNYKYQQ